MTDKDKDTWRTEIIKVERYSGPTVHGAKYAVSTEVPIPRKGGGFSDKTYWLSSKGKWVRSRNESCLFPSEELARDFLRLRKAYEKKAVLVGMLLMHPIANKATKFLQDTMPKKEPEPGPPVFSVAEYEFLKRPRCPISKMKWFRDTR